MNQEAAREQLLAHARSDRNGIFPIGANVQGKITNPLCGDQVELQIVSDGKIIQDIGFKSASCAICSASSSLLIQMIKNKNVQTALNWAKQFERTLIENEKNPWPSELQSLICFEHLRINHSRRMCALLPWVVLKSAFRNTGGKNENFHNDQ